MATKISHEVTVILTFTFEFKWNFVLYKMKSTPGVPEYHIYQNRWKIQTTGYYFKMKRGKACYIYREQVHLTVAGRKDLL